VKAGNARRPPKWIEDVWTDLIDWNRSIPAEKDDGLLSKPNRKFLDRLHALCREECVFTLFAHKRKSVEALRLGWVTTNPYLPTPSLSAGLDREQFGRLVDVAVRLLGERRQYRGSDSAYHHDTLPKGIQAYIKKSAGANDAKDWTDRLRRYLIDSRITDDGLVLNTNNLFFQPRPPGGPGPWVCRRCGTVLSTRRSDAASPAWSRCRRPRKSHVTSRTTTPFWLPRRPSSSASTAKK
jgi:DEAD/DEAH box helicase domain-containing protein